MFLILAALWAWMALAYHLAHFAAINRAAPLFAALFLAASIAFAWLALRGTPLRRDAPFATTGWVLAAVALQDLALGAAGAITLFTLGRSARGGFDPRKGPAKRAA